MGPVRARALDELLHEPGDLLPQLAGVPERVRHGLEGDVVVGGANAARGQHHGEERGLAADLLRNGLD